MDPLVVIYGSTGTGKSDLAVELATRFNGEIINADAMQMYRGLPIITNKLTDAEQCGIAHHLLGNIGLEEEPWTVTHFKREATRIIAEIRSRGRLPIVVGGTSYYLDGLLFDDRLVEDQALPETGLLNRDDVAAKYPILTAPTDVMLKKLREVDPVMADRWHPNDVRKIRNSLEIFLATGRRASDIYEEQRIRKESKWASESGAAKAQSPWKTLMFWLFAKPDVLTDRLDKRVDKMVQNGLLGETAEVYEYLQSRLATGEVVDRTKGIWQSIGFKQFEPYLRALKETPESLALEKLRLAGIEDTKSATRRYAKYQTRWITMKTLSSLQQEKALDRLFLLDSSDIQHWSEEVLDKGAELTRKLLADEDLPQAVDISETARQVLTATVERSNRQETKCHKTCELCEKTFLTEDLWQKHVKSKRHRKAVEWTKRSALVAVDPRSRALQTTQAIPDQFDPL